MTVVEAHPSNHDSVVLELGACGTRFSRHSIHATRLMDEPKKHMPRKPPVAVQRLGKEGEGSPPNRPFGA